MVNFGIMGAGKIARDFCAAARCYENAQVVAVASKDLKRAADFAKSEQIKSAATYAQMLASPEIDAVYIATTNNFHMQNLLDCLEAGKHVLCEKPITLGYDECKTVTGLAKQKGLLLMEGMWSRFLPKTDKVRQWIKEGRIGKVHTIQANIGYNGGTDYSSRQFNKELGGGAMYDLGVYLIDLIPYFVDQKIVEIKSSSDFLPNGVDTTTRLEIVLDSCVAHGFATFTNSVPEECYIYGDNGYIKIPRIHWGKDAILLNKSAEVVEDFKGDDVPGFYYELKSFVECMEKGLLENPIAPHSMSFENAKIYEQVMS